METEGILAISALMCGILGFILLMSDKPYAGIICIITATVCMIAGCIIDAKKQQTDFKVKILSHSVEFSASQYNLDYKIVEFQGKVDTIYVLIPKEYNKYKNGN